ncbi:MAG TPA: hypothetical protein VFN06_03795, partial [Gaiellaceae bacterium]|nr:hypothetical protein [Gaiellaceae bacterium]
MVAIAALTALATARSAAAHIVALPAFVASGSSESVTFSGPNERDVPMTGFALVLPAGLQIAHAHEVDGWDESVDGQTATWLGGPLAPTEEIGFGITLDAELEPGVVELQAVQRYADGNEVSWPVSLTITPEEESPSQNLALAS